MTVMTAIEELDAVLNYLNTTGVWSELRKHFTEINREQLRTILRKLRRDGYIDLLDDGVKLRAWDDEHEYSDKMIIQKNFEGYLFCQEGGYHEKFAKEKTQTIRLENLETTQIKMGTKLNVVTAWIAGGTIALVVVEIIKFMYEIYHPSNH
jgi:hypothetical protein